jgi:hypothetical protein
MMSHKIAKLFLAFISLSLSLSAQKMDYWVRNTNIGSIVVQNDTLFVQTKATLHLLKTDGTKIADYSLPDGISEFKLYKDPSSGSVVIYSDMNKAKWTIEKGQLIRADYFADKLAYRINEEAQNQQILLSLRPALVFMDTDKEYRVPCYKDDCQRMFMEFYFDQATEKCWLVEGYKLHGWDGEKWSTTDLTDGLAHERLTGTKYLFPLIPKGKELYYQKGEKWEILKRPAHIPEFRDYYKARLLDQKGNLWLPSDDNKSLIRFDGRDWALFPIPLNAGDVPRAEQFFVSAMAEDEVGNIWMGDSDGRLLRFTVKDKSWKNITLSNLESDFSLSPRRMTPDNKGHFWMVGDGTVYKVEDTIVARFQRENIDTLNFNYAYFSPDVICVDAKDRLWAAPQEYLYNYDGSKWKIVDIDEYAGFFADETGGMMALNTDGELKLFDENLDNISTQLLTDGRIWETQFLRDASKNIWITTRNDKQQYSLFKISPDDKVLKFDKSTCPIFDASKKIKIFMAPDGKLWASSSLGIAYYEGEKWSTLNLDQTIYLDFNNDGYELAFDKDGGTWVLFDTKLMYYKDGKWSSNLAWLSCLAKATAARKSTLFVDSKNRLWIALYNQLVCIENGICKTYIEETSFRPSQIFEDANGTVWVFTELNGVLRVW